MLSGNFNLDRDLSKNPLFQVMFTHERAVAAAAGRLRAEVVPPPRVAETLDLSVRVMERQDTIELRFSYSTDLFAASTIARMASHYRMLLGAGSESPEFEVVEPSFVDACRAPTVAGGLEPDISEPSGALHSGVFPGASL